MPHNFQHIESLIDKYLAGTATEQEKQEVQNWYHSFNDAEVNVAVKEEAFRQKLEERMKERLLADINSEPTAVIPMPNRYRRQLAIAASVIILLGLSFYALLHFSRNETVSPIAAVEKTGQADKVVPGSNKAILTLSDGSIVELDSSAKGNITQQGNVVVSKMANGQIAYSINGKTITENDAAFYNTITTPRGGQYQVTLSDGTAVWLNAASSIRFPVVFAGNERLVTITGEAYLEVAKNKEKPFRVDVGDAVVEVLGTHFNINAYADEPFLQTTLVEGSVRVTNRSNRSFSTVISPGQQAKMSADGNIAVLDHADIEQTLAWKNGIFLFKSTDLTTILRQIGRWYDVEIEYQGSANMNFTGQLTRNEEVTDVLKKLALTEEVNFKLTGRKIIVTRR